MSNVESQSPSPSLVPSPPLVLSPSSTPGGRGAGNHLYKGPAASGGGGGGGSAGRGGGGGLGTRGPNTL